MVSEVHLQGDIDDLKNYLSYGKSENKNRTEDRTERVDWESGRNVAGAESIGLAKRQMQWTAASSKVEKPVYQIIISWQSGNAEEGIPPDDPSREEMEETADRVLEGLGLSEHQAWIVAHKDTETKHMHVMVNRVHPEENTAWSRMRDQKNIYSTLREIEEEKGWHQPAPSKIEDKWAQDREKSLQYWEEEHEKWDRERSVRLWAREEGIQTALREAQSWEEATTAVQQRGARLEAQNRRGMVLKRGEKSAALSSIDPKISRPRLEQRYGESWEAYQGESPPRTRSVPVTRENRGETAVRVDHSYNTSRLKKQVAPPPDSGLSRRERTLRRRLPSALEETEWTAVTRPGTLPGTDRRPWRDGSDLLELRHRGLDSLSSEQVHLAMPDTTREPDLPARDIKRLTKRIEGLRRIEETHEDGARPDGGSQQERVEERYQDYEDLKRAVGEQVNQLSDAELKAVAEHLDAEGQEIARRAADFERNERLYEEAQGFYQETLEQTPDRSPQKQYVKERTHGQEKEGEVGLAPDEWGEFKKQAKGQGFTERDLVEADLAKERRDDTRARLKRATNEWVQSFSTTSRNQGPVWREQAEDFQAYLRGQGFNGNGNVRDQIAEDEDINVQPVYRSGGENGIEFSGEQGAGSQTAEYWKVQIQEDQYLIPAPSSLERQISRQNREAGAVDPFVEKEFRSGGDVLKFDREGRGVTPIPLRNGDPNTAAQRWDRAGRKVPNGKGVFDTFKNELVYASRDENGRIRKLQGRWNEGTRDPKIPERNTRKPTLKNVQAHEPGKAVFGAQHAQSQAGGEVFVTEGFSDALAARSAGRKAVGLTGNNITEEEADLIADLAGEEDPKVTVMLDGEDGGRVGSINVVEEMEKRGVPVDVVRPPEGMDVDEMTKAEGEDALNEYIESHRVDGLEYSYQKAAVAEGLPTEEVGPVKTAERFDRTVGIAASAPTEEKREQNFGRLLEMEGLKEEGAKHEYELVRESFEEKLTEKGYAEPEMGSSPDWLGRQDEQASVSESEAKGPKRDVSSAENVERDVQVPEDPEALKQELYLGDEGQKPAIETEETRPKGETRPGEPPSSAEETETTGTEETAAADPEGAPTENRGSDSQGVETGPTRFESENGAILIEDHEDPGAKRVVQRTGDDETVREPVHEGDVFAITSTIAESEEAASPTETREEIAEELSKRLFDGELAGQSEQVEPADVPIALRGDEEEIQEFREKWISVTERLRKDHSHEEAKQELIGEEGADLADVYVEHLNEPKAEIGSTERPVRPAHFDDGTPTGREKRDKVLTEGIEQRIDGSEEIFGHTSRGQLTQGENGEVQVNRVSRERSSFGVGGPKGGELPDVREKEIDVVVAEVRQSQNQSYRDSSYYAVPGPNDGEIDVPENAFDLERPDELVEEHRKREERRVQNLQRVYMGKSDEPQKSIKETPEGVDTKDHLASVNPNHEPADDNTAAEERLRFAAEVNWDAVRNAEVTDGRYETREHMRGGRYETARAEVPIEYVFEDPEGHYQHDINWPETTVEQPGKFVDPETGEHSFPAERGHYYGKVFDTAKEAEERLKTDIRESLIEEHAQAFRENVESDVRSELEEAGVRDEIRSEVEDEVLGIDQELREELEEETQRIRSELSAGPAEEAGKRPNAPSEEVQGPTAGSQTGPEQVPGGTRAVEKGLDEAGLSDELQEAREKLNEGLSENQEAEIERETTRRFEKKVQIEAKSRLRGLEGETLTAQEQRKLRENGTEADVRATVREEVLGIDESNRQELEETAKEIRRDLRQEESTEVTNEAVREEIDRLIEDGELPERLEKTWQSVKEAGEKERSTIDQRTDDRLQERAQARVAARRGERAAEVQVREQVRRDLSDYEGENEKTFEEAVDEEVERRINDPGRASGTGGFDPETVETNLDAASIDVASLGEEIRPEENRSIGPASTSQESRVEGTGVGVKVPGPDERTDSRTGTRPREQVKAAVDEKIEEKLNQPVLDPDGVYDGEAPERFDPEVTRGERVANAKGKGVDPETGEKTQENPVLIEESWAGPAEEDYKISLDNVGEVIPAQLEKVEGDTHFRVAEKGRIKRTRDTREVEKTLSFGKHEGKTVQQVVEEDREYAENIARDFSERPDLQDAFREAIVEADRTSQESSEKFGSIGQGAMSFKESERETGKIRRLEERLKTDLAKRQRTLEAQAEVKRKVRDDLRSVGEIEDLETGEQAPSTSEDPSEETNIQSEGTEREGFPAEEIPSPADQGPATENAEWNKIEQTLRSREDLRERDKDLEAINERLSEQLASKDKEALAEQHDDRAEELLQNRSRQQDLGTRQKEVISQIETANEEIREGLDEGASSQDLDDLHQRQTDLIREQERIRGQENDLVEEEERIADVTEGYRREIQQRDEAVPQSSKNLAQIAAEADIQKTEQTRDVARRIATTARERQALLERWKRQVDEGRREAPAETNLDTAIEQAKARNERFEGAATVAEIDLEEKREEVGGLEILRAESNEEGQSLESEESREEDVRDIPSPEEAERTGREKATETFAPNDVTDPSEELKDLSVREEELTEHLGEVQEQREDADDVVRADLAADLARERGEVRAKQEALEETYDLQPTASADTPSRTGRTTGPQAPTEPETRDQLEASSEREPASEPEVSARSEGPTGSGTGDPTGGQGDSGRTDAGEPVPSEEPVASEEQPQEPAEQAPEVEEDLTIEQYLEERSEASEPRQRALDEEFSVEEIRIHRDGLRRELRDQQVAAIEANRRVGYLNEDIKEASREVEEKAETGEVSEIRSTLGDLQSATEDRDSAEEELSTITSSRRRIAQQAHRTNEVIHDRTGKVEDDSIDVKRRQARNREQIHRERSARLEQQAETEQHAATGLAATGNRIAQDDFAEGEDKQLDGHFIKESRNRLKKAKDLEEKATSAESLAEEASQRAQGFAAYADDRGLRTEGGEITEEDLEDQSNARSFEDGADQLETASSTQQEEVSEGLEDDLEERTAAEEAAAEEASAEEASAEETSEETEPIDVDGIDLDEGDEDPLGQFQDEDVQDEGAQEASEETIDAGGAGDVIEDYQTEEGELRIRESGPDETVTIEWDPSEIEVVQSKEIPRSDWQREVRKDTERYGISTGDHLSTYYFDGGAKKDNYLIAEPGDIIERYSGEKGEIRIRQNDADESVTVEQHTADGDSVQSKEIDRSEWREQAGREVEIYGINNGKHLSETYFNGELQNDLESITYRSEDLKEENEEVETATEETTAEETVDTERGESFKQDLRDYRDLREKVADDFDPRKEHTYQELSKAELEVQTAHSQFEIEHGADAEDLLEEQQEVDESIEDIPSQEVADRKDLQDKASKAGTRLHTPRGGSSRDGDYVRMEVSYEAVERAEEEERAVRNVLEDIASGAESEEKKAEAQSLLESLEARSEQRTQLLLEKEGESADTGETTAEEATAEEGPATAGPGSETEQAEAGTDQADTNQANAEQSAPEQQSTDQDSERRDSARQEEQSASPASGPTENLQNRREKLTAQAQRLSDVQQALTNRLEDEDVSERERERTRQQVENLREDFNALQKEVNQIKNKIDEALSQDPDAGQTEGEEAGETSQLEEGAEADRTSEVVPPPTQEETRHAEEAGRASAADQNGSTDQNASDLDEGPSLGERETSSPNRGIGGAESGVRQLRSERDLLQSRQGTYIDENRDRIEYVSDRNSELQDKARQLNNLVKDGASTDEIESVRQEISEKRAARANVEQQIAEGREEVQKRETKIAKIEEDLSNRGHMTAGDFEARQARLRGQGEISQRLEDVEQERESFAELQADTMSRLQRQVENGERYAPETFDPAEESQTFRALSARAAEAQKDFQEQYQETMRRARLAGERAPNEAEGRKARPSEQDSSEAPNVDPARRKVDPSKVQGQGVEGESVAETQMKQDLKEVAEAERDARQAFDQAYRDGAKARSRLEENMFTEGVDERTRSFKKALDQVSGRPEDYGKLAEERSQNIGEVLAQKEQAATAKRREFRQKYGGRRAEDLARLADREDRETIQALRQPDVRDPKIRQEAAETLRQRAEDRSQRLREQFLETAKRGFENAQKVERAYNDNKSMYGEETAREVLKNPAAYAGKDLAFQSPGPRAKASASEELQNLDNQLRQANRDGKAYRQIEEMARLQSSERDALEGLRSLKEEPTSEAEQTTWDRLQSPESARQSSASQSKTKEKIARKELEQSYERQRPQESVDEVIRLVEKAERKEDAAKTLTEARAASRPTRNGGSTVADEKADLKDKLASAFEEDREHVASAEGRASSDAFQERASQAAEIIANERNGAGIETIAGQEDAPRQVEEAAQIVKEMREGERDVNAGSMLKEGIRQNNDILRHAGRTRIAKDVEMYGHSYETVDSERTPDDETIRESVASFQRMYDETKEEWKTMPRTSGIEKEIYDRVDQLEPSEKERLRREASRDERAEQALSIADGSRPNVGARVETGAQKQTGRRDSSNAETTDSGRTQTQSRGGQSL